MIVVTGGAGFIGSNIVAALEARGHHDVVVCDWLGAEDKWRNIAKREIEAVVRPDDLFEFLSREGDRLEAVFHMGAISATTETDGDKIIETYTDIGRTVVQLEEAQMVAEHVRRLLDEGEFDVCTVIFNHFVSAMTQIVTPQQLIPVALDEKDAGSAEEEAASAAGGPRAVYEYEPSQGDILGALLPANLEVQIFRAMLESGASEHGARMTAMDNATRNAGEMIDDLTMTFNRTRQAQITSELIEIISGAEAL